MANAVQVVDMRLRQIATGNGTPEEMFLMVAEKIDAAAEVRTILMWGGDCNQVIHHYSKIVLANVQRLTG